MSGAFHHVYRVRFDESGVDGLARAATILRYVQDIAWLHSESLGFDRAWYAARGIGWLVRAAELAIHGRIPMGADLDLTTTVVGHRKVWARRRSEATLSGAPVGWVHTDWVLVDARGAPVRIPPEFDEAFPNPIAGFPIGRVQLSTSDQVADRAFRVRPHELDPNGHVNNAVYVDWLDESIPDDASIGTLPRRYRIEYAAAAGPGAALIAQTWRDGDSWSHRLRSGDGSEIARARLEI